MEADDQAIQTILMGLLEDIYAAVDSCETAQEIWLRVQQMMKEKIANNLKFLNNLQQEWSCHVTIVHQTKDLHEVNYTQLYDFLKYNQKEVNELRTERLARAHDPLAPLENSNNPYNYLVFHPNQQSQVTYTQQPQPNNNYLPQPSFNQNYMQQLMINTEDISDPTTAIIMALVLIVKAFKLNYSTPTNNNQIISSNLRNRKITEPCMNMGQDKHIQMVGSNGGNQFRQYAGQNNVGNQNGLVVVPGIANPNVNQHGNGNVVAVRAEGIQLQAEDFDLMAAARDLDEI
nr:hypothetical protein [Tanacetum cinerariifolium]